MAECSNTRECTCTYPGCPRHGKCCECVAHHRDHEGGIPGCFWSEEGEKLWDRSLDLFIKDKEKSE